MPSMHQGLNWMFGIYPFPGHIFFFLLLDIKCWLHMSNNSAGDMVTKPTCHLCSSSMLHNSHITGQNGKSRRDTRNARWAMDWECVICMSMCATDLCYNLVRANTTGAITIKFAWRFRTISYKPQQSCTLIPQWWPDRNDANYGDDSERE